MRAATAEAAATVDVVAHGLLREIEDTGDLGIVEAFGISLQHGALTGLRLREPQRRCAAARRPAAASPRRCLQ
jgi:hypothetical protein